MNTLAQTAERIGLTDGDLEPYGRDIAKISLQTVARAQANPRGRVVLVSAMTPTPAGEGKTTTSIGLAQGMAKIGCSVCLALREPSLGPCMGMKGGATGGGASSLVPAERINLHFTGDMHAISSAHNLLAAAIDNHVYFDKQPTLDVRRVRWPRALDMNDRALRHMVVGLGGPSHGQPRESSFVITAASEVMAVLCLARDAIDLEARLSRMVVGFTRARKPVTVADLNLAGGMVALLHDAIKPNLVRTQEGVPALVHGGPFANIAHGCNSVIATQTARGLADWVITEAGFAFDLGGEKFLDIKCRSSGLPVHVVVLVATIRALKMHGGVPKSELAAPNPAAVQAGISNLERHIETSKTFGLPTVVALNRFGGDTSEEIDVVKQSCEQAGVRFAASDHFVRGGDGARDLAELVCELGNNHGHTPQYLYEVAEPLEDKLQAVAAKAYGARRVSLTPQAKRQQLEIEELGFGALPVCIAKTQYSLSDDASRLGRPHAFDITIRGLELAAGAGFIVALAGDVMRMPGLPRVPRAENVRLVGESIVGLMND